jgi:23S rRNA (uracil1939-C5)-methyltransferase
VSESPAGELAVGQTVEFAVEKAVYRGRGLGRVDGRVVFVARAYPGDRIRARVSALHSGWAEAALVDVLEPTPARRPAPCPNGPACGGCSYQEIAYQEQLRLKANVLRESLARARAPFAGEIPAHASPEQGWRLRASLHFASGSEGLRMGFREEGTHRVADFRACVQLSDRTNDAARTLRDALSRRPALHRQLRGLDLLEAPDGTALVAVVVTTLRGHETRELASFARQIPGLTGFGVECHPRRLQWLHGDPHVEASVLGLRLRAHVRSFFQSNRFLLEPLARSVTDLVPRGGGQILDLYSGVGLFALPLSAREDAPVIAVEHAGFSSEDARANARRLRLRLNVIESDVAEALVSLPHEADERIVLDPPRTGAGEGVVDLVAGRQPSCIVYVSCDPPTLGRDLARFAVHGYRPDSVQIFDLFPNTFHLETVARLRRA